MTVLYSLAFRHFSVFPLLAWAPALAFRLFSQCNDVAASCLCVNSHLSCVCIFFSARGVHRKQRGSRTRPNDEGKISELCSKKDVKNDGSFEETMKINLSFSRFSVRSRECSSDETEIKLTKRKMCNRMSLPVLLPLDVRAKMKQETPFEQRQPIECVTFSAKLICVLCALARENRLGNRWNFGYNFQFVNGRTSARHYSFCRTCFARLSHFFISASFFVQRLFTSHLRRSADHMDELIFGILQFSFASDRLICLQTDHEVDERLSTHCAAQQTDRCAPDESRKNTIDIIYSIF